MVTTSTTTKRGFEIVKHAPRLTLELAAALLLLAFASETWTHRLFSPDPHYRFVIKFFAILIGLLGLLPLAYHLSARAGRLLLIAWLSSFGLLLIGANITR